MRRGEEVRAISHQCAHVGYARPLGHLCALRTRRNTLRVRCGLTRQTALVYLEVEGSKQAHVHRNVVEATMSAPGFFILFIIYYGYLLSTHDPIVHSIKLPTYGFLS